MQFEHSALNSFAFASPRFVISSLCFSYAFNLIYPKCHYTANSHKNIEQIKESKQLSRYSIVYKRDKGLYINHVIMKSRFLDYPLSIAFPSKINYRLLNVP